MIFFRAGWENSGKIQSHPKNLHVPTHMVPIPVVSFPDLVSGDSLFETTEEIDSDCSSFDQIPMLRLPLG